MAIKFAGGTVYAVFPNCELTPSDKVPSLTMHFEPRRRTLKWKGRRFNVPTMRLVRIGSAAPFEASI